MSFKRWRIPQLNKEAAAALAGECGLHPFLALLLYGRGVDTAEKVADFLLGRELNDDHFGFAGMDAAVERIQRAVENHERMAVFGDYDADGITSTVLLYTYLKTRGADVFYHIPQREGEGYGLHRESVDQLAEQGAQLIITVDNGIAAVDEVAYAKERGMDVVVTDHHRPQETLPDAVAVVDPHREDCGSAFSDYAGVGVAFKLICALEGDEAAVLERGADLVALGTLADVMPLEGENRVLVRAGLRLMNTAPRPGLAALAKAAGFGDKEHTATSAVFTLAPRINAAGRMGSPDVAARLLLSDSEEEATPYADEVQRLNTERQTVEAAILAEVLERFHTYPELLADRVLVVEGDNWHPGVLGILASRVVERYGKPCVMLTIQDGEAKGSGRSIRGFPLFEAIQSAADSLITYGGHELAAGVSLQAADIGRFRDQLNAYAAEHFPMMPVPEMVLDAKLSPAQADLEKCELIRALEPFGTGNPVPQFGLFDMRLDNVAPVGGGKHLRLSVSRGDVRLSVMRFHTTPDAFPVECGTPLHLVVTLERSEFRGVVSTTLIARDIRYADTDEEAVLSGMAAFDRVMRGEPLTAEQAAELLPSREQTAAVYRCLHGSPVWQGTLEQLYHAVGEPALGYGRLRVILEELREAVLLDVRDGGDLLQLTLLPAQGKSDLQQTAVMRKLREAVNTPSAQA